MSAKSINLGVGEHNVCDCLHFNERLSIHCNIREFTFAQEEFQILCSHGGTTINYPSGAFWP